MDSVIVNLLAGLGVLWFIALCGYSVYLRLIAPEPDENANKVGKLLWYFGSVVIVGTLIVGMLTLAIIFAYWIINAIGMGYGSI